MQKTILLLFFYIFLCFGCSYPWKNFNTFYDPNYKVIDRGGKNVIVVGRSCSIFPERAFSAAKRSAEYNLRSVIGSRSHKKEYQKIRQYTDGEKTCIEIYAKSSSSL